MRVRREVLDKLFFFLVTKLNFNSQQHSLISNYLALTPVTEDPFYLFRQVAKVKTNFYMLTQYLRSFKNLAIIALCNTQW